MSSPEPTKKKEKAIGMTKEEADIFFARVDIARARTEALADAWLARLGHPIPPKMSQAQIDAEDAALFPVGSSNLGLGAEQNNNKSLRAKFFPAKGLKASKARDTEEKAASAKRGLRVESSDEEEGRSGLGRAKKQKTSKRSEPADATPEDDQAGQLPLITTTINTKKFRAKAKDVPFMEAVIDSIESPTRASPTTTAQTPAELLSAEHENNTLQLPRSSISGAKDRKQAKKDRKEERRKAKTELVDHMEVDVAPKNDRDEQDMVGHMDVDTEPKLKMSKQERKELKILPKLAKKSEEREEELVRNSAEKDFYTMAVVSNHKGQVALKKPTLSHNDETELDDKDKSASEEIAAETAQSSQAQGTLSKEEKNRAKKQRKREKKKRAMAATELKSS